MEKRGIFIVIEGTDGSGKGTQFKLISEKLQAAGHDVETFDFPQYDQPSSYFVKRYLNGDYGDAEEVGPYTSSLFYALDRFEAAPRIRQALKDGKIVISNRFTGSSMAHQGTKIANAEQRRGFFIWLDNLEFEMLRIPRPDISFVLRVPADIAQKLVDQKAERSYTDKKRDLHEADLTHMERSVVVYDDLTQLFPKDFERIDCIRNGQLLDIDTVNTMLWEKIAPRLPKPAAKISPKKAAQPEPAALPETTQESAPEKSAATAVDYLTLANASGLLTQKIERLTASAEVEHPTVPAIFTPENLVPSAQKEYAAKTSSLLGLYAKLVAGLGKHGIDAVEARRNAGQVLPIAATASVKINPNDPALEELIIGLINDDLPEAQAAGASLFAQAIKSGNSLFKDGDQHLKRAAPTKVKALAEEFLAENYIGENAKVQLTAVWPRNESDLIADMLYGHSSLPLRTIQDRLATWPINRKLAIFEAYTEHLLADGQPGPALEKAHYSWDLLTPYSVFRELQTQPSEGLEMQPLTPRYGFDMPELIEEAGLSETFEKCFDLSLELYSTLQEAGHQTEAQYVTLYGHHQRWTMTQNAGEAIKLQKLPARTPETRQFLAEMQAALAETHPIIGETIAQLQAEA